MGRYLDIKIILYTIIIGALILILYVLIRLRKKPDYTHMKQGTLQQCLSECNTGDIISVSYGSLRGELIKVFTGSMWAHAGVIIKTYNGPYVLEAGRYNLKRRGILTTPLSVWLSWNNGNTIAWRKYEGIGLDKKEILKFISHNKNSKEDMFVANWIWSMFKINYNHSNNPHRRKYYCSQFVTHFLQESGIFKKKYDPSGYKPWELIYGELPLKENHNYKSPLVIADPRKTLNV